MAEMGFSTSRSGTVHGRLERAPTSGSSGSGGRRGYEYLCCDNRLEFATAAIHDWCRFFGTGTSFVDPG